VGPDPAQVAEERLVEILDNVTQTLLEDPPATQEALPASVLQALCLQHSRFREHAAFEKLQVEEVRLQEKLKKLEKQRDEAPLQRRRMKPSSKQSHRSDQYGSSHPDPEDD